MIEAQQHLVMVRHGEGAGDVRRAAWKRGEPYVSLKKPEDEEITTNGIGQSRLAKQWIGRHILDRYAIKSFDGYFVSLSPRSVQTAIAMGFENVIWLGDERLNERNRGYVRGLKPEQHRELFPESYKQMKADPLHWVPPGGESIIDVMKRWRSFHDDIRDLRNVIIIGHRDQMWAAQQPLEHLSDSELLAVNTDNFSNGYIMDYSSISPETGKQAPGLIWKYEVNPMQPETSPGWQILPHVAERYNIAV